MQQDDIRKLVANLNTLLSRPLSVDLVNQTFERAWSSLEDLIGKVELEGNIEEPKIDSLGGGAEGQALKDNALAGHLTGNQAHALIVLGQAEDEIEKAQRRNRLAWITENGVYKETSVFKGGQPLSYREPYPDFLGEGFSTRFHPRSLDALAICSAKSIARVQHDMGALVEKGLVVSGDGEYRLTQEGLEFLLSNELI